MIVYGDILLENFIIGGVLIYITAEIFNIKFRGKGAKLRFVLGAVMCGAFSLEIFLNVRAPAAVLSEVLFAFLMCLAVFGKKKICHKVVVLILVTYFMGGLTMGLLFVTQNPGIYTAAGIYTGDLKAAVLAMFIGIGTFTVKQIIKTVSNGKFYSEHVFDVKIIIGEMAFETKGFFDTGNQLKDPISGKPVAVAQESLWRRLEESGIMEHERIGIVPYETIGAKGLLTSLRVDAMEVDGRKFKGNIIAQGIKEFNICGKAAAECELLLSRDMSDRDV